MSIILPKENSPLIIESNFFPSNNQINLGEMKEMKDYCCPTEFVLVPENLFNKFYNKIDKSEKYTKDDYKFNILIGDNVLFIQDKKIKNIFYTYTFVKDNNLEIRFLFKYNKEEEFYKEVKKYIKDKGFNNYLIERNIDVYNINKLNYLENKENEVIGQYINYKILNKNDIKRIKINI